MKAPITDWMYRTAARILAIVSLEIHYKKAGYEWINLPLSKEFMELYKRYHVRTTSLVDIGRLHPLYQFLSYAIKLDGDVAQLGVYKGGSTAVLASLVEKTGKTYHAFDTYEGLPKTKTEDNINGYKDSGKPELADTSLESVQKYLNDYSCIEYHKGYFPDTAIRSSVAEKKFCFVYLDADLYQSTKDGLEFFYPKLSKGGVIVIDDYGGRRWAGVKTAIDEFMPKNKGAVLMQIAAGQAIMVKIP